MHNVCVSYKSKTFGYLTCRKHQLGKSYVKQLAQTSTFSQNQGVNSFNATESHFNINNNDTIHCLSSNVRLQITNKVNGIPAHTYIHVQHYVNGLSY